LTFERAIIDAQASFAHGQVYVALSRCKTLEGMVLSTPIRNRSIINDQTVSGFTQEIAHNQPNAAQFQSARIAYQQDLLLELFRFIVFRNRILYIEKIINENRGSIPAPTQQLFNQLFPTVQQNILEVADRFHAQIHRLLPQQPDVEINTALQERIASAAGYFSEKIKSLILDLIPRADLDLDNKAVKKQLNDAVNRLEEDARIKYESLAACRSGFRLTALLKAKAEAAIEKEKPKENRKPIPLTNEDVAHPVLFNRLRAWRMEKSTEMNVPPYAVFSQQALFEMVNYLPLNTKDLLKIHGIGQKKLHQFGEEILDIIQNYCEEK
jgi:hypothetical protein